MSTIDVARRFGGVSRLYGSAGLAKLQAAHVVVIGIGGVGSWAAEAMARNAVGTITLMFMVGITGLGQSLFIMTAMSSAPTCWATSAPCSKKWAKARR